MPVALNVTGLPVSPLADAVTLFAPATAPSVHEVTVAMPLAFVTTDVGDTVPPPLAIANVTVVPLTTLPKASVTFTLGGAATFVLTVADCVVLDCAAMVTATPAVPVALNVTGLPVRPDTVAVTLFAPAVVPTVHELSVAIPLALVTTLVDEMLPPPLAMANVTVTPLTALLPASVTSTLGGAATFVLTVADCVVVEFAASVVAAPAATVNEPEFTLSAGDDVVNCNVCVPMPVICSELNVATPLDAVAVEAPPSVPLPLAFAAVTRSVAPEPVVTTSPA